MAVPKYDELFNPLIKALHNLGGSGSVSEIDSETASVLKLSDKDLNEIHRGNRTKFTYRLAWSRNYLKRYGLLENSSRGVWALTQTGLKTNEVDKNVVNKKVKSLDYSLEKNQIKESEHNIPDQEGWKDMLINQIMKLDPGAFERLCQRVLRESGFYEVNVTGRTGDGGIDGVGKVRVGGLISFKVVFQCKRYKGNIPSKHIRDFRGAMMGRADKGLFITTSTYTQDAKREAERDGAFAIDLIDGDLLAEKMKDLGLGVKVKNEEIVKFDPDWFKTFDL